MRMSAVAKASRRWAAALRGPRGRLMSLLLSGLIVAPAQAMAEEIPFFVSNDSNFVESCIVCGGPWFRKTAPCGTPVPPGTRREHFYSAELNIFSPLGLWFCDFRSCQECGLPRNRIEFCLDVQPERIVPVEITVAPRGHFGFRLEVNFSPPPCWSVAAVGFLGDVGRAGRRDRDVFRFDGEAGETITVSLQRDGTSGSAGEIAELILREERGRRLDRETGALPLELTATLPAAGSYAIEALEVRESAGDPGGPFRGHFFLTVRSDAEGTRGESLLLEPTERTEP